MRDSIPEDLCYMNGFSNPFSFSLDGKGHSMDYDFHVSSDVFQNPVGSIEIKVVQDPYVKREALEEHERMGERNNR